MSRIGSAIKTSYLFAARGWLSAALCRIISSTKLKCMAPCCDNFILQFAAAILRAPIDFADFNFNTPASALMWVARRAMKQRGSRPRRSAQTNALDFG